MPYGTKPINLPPGKQSAAGASSLAEKLLGMIVDRFVIPKLHLITPIDLASNATANVKTGEQQATLLLISVFSGTLDLYLGDVTPSANSLPYTRITPNGFPSPVPLPPDTYKFTVHAAQSTALRACVIASNA